MKNLILLLLLLATPLAAYNSSNGLVYVPKAVMENVGYAEYGLVNNFYQSPELESTKYQAQGYFRYAISDSFEYSVSVLDTLQAVHNLHGNVWSYKDEAIGLGHDLAFGVKNVGWSEPKVLVNEPVYDMFAAYSLTILGSGSSYHFGVARDKLGSELILYTLGAEYAFPFGVATVEWDGRSVHLGYKYYSGEQFLFYVAISPMPLEREDISGYNQRYVSMGISFRSNIIDRFREQMVSRKTLDKEIDKINQRISLIESKEKALAEVTSASFLDELEKQYLDNKLFEKDVRNGSKSLVKGALSHMQRGLEYYYQGDYKAALEEYKVVVSLMPNFSMGHARLGSIYHQQGNVIRARDHWEKALALNPRNEALRKLLKDQLNQTDTKTFVEVLDPVEVLESDTTEAVDIEDLEDIQEIEDTVDEEDFDDEVFDEEELVEEDE